MASDEYIKQQLRDLGLDQKDVLFPPPSSPPPPRQESRRSSLSSVLSSGGESHKSKRMPPQPAARKGSPPSPEQKGSSPHDFLSMFDTKPENPPPPQPPANPFDESFQEKGNLSDVSMPPGLTPFDLPPPRASRHSSRRSHRPPSGGSSIVSRNLRPTHRDPEEIIRIKRNLLFDIDRFSAMGHRYIAPLTLASSLDEIEYAFEKLRNEVQRKMEEQDIEAGIISTRRIVMFFVTSIEQITSWPWFRSRVPGGNKIHLKGWSASMASQMEDSNFRNILTRLYIKYRMRRILAPELELFFALTMSAVTFSMANSIFHNPEIASATSNLARKGFNLGSIGQNIADKIQNVAASTPVSAAPPQPGPSNIDDILKEMKN